MSGKRDRKRRSQRSEEPQRKVTLKELHLLYSHIGGNAVDCDIISVDEAQEIVERVANQLFKREMNANA